MYGFGEMMDEASEAPPMITAGIAAAESGESSAEQMLREGLRTGCRRDGEARLTPAALTR
jgi:hypothetical protein